MLKNQKRVEEANKLEDDYAYIYILFDSEFQDNLFSIKEKKLVLNEMLRHFNDETENGLLLISYPMIEAFKDCNNSLPDKTFLDRYISLKDLKNHKYKEIVDKRGMKLNIYKDLNDDLYYPIFFQNLYKAHIICKEAYNTPTYEEFLEYLKGETILNKEFDLIKNSNNIAILSTSIFLIVSYFGENLYKEIINKYNFS